MIDVNWDENAKAAAMEFACYIGKAKDCERYFKHIAPKTKTVADAVEAFPDGWPEKGMDVCVWDVSCNRFLFWLADYVKAHDFYEVCTREQFETYVKEQECEKWTHLYTDDTGTDIRCKLLAEHGEWAWIEDAGTVDTIRKSWLKPIKPEMTKEEHEVLCKFSAD